MSVISPPALPNTSMAFPAYSLGTSTVASSIGSSLRPSASFLMMTRGRPTWNSKPSRRMVSMSTERCSTPRPATSMPLLSSSSAMRMEMLLSASRRRRSFSWRAPTISPSRPTSGLLDASKTTAMVGSSISMGSRRTGVSRLVTMSPMSASSTPTTATMSPACTSSCSFLPSSSNVNTCLMVVLYRVPSFLMTSAGSFLWMVPENRRPTPMRPTKLEWSTVQIWSATGPFGSQSGAGHFLQNGFQQGNHVHVFVLRCVPGVAVHRAGVDDGEVQLLVGGLQFHHEVEHLVHHFFGATAGPVDLVDDHHDAQSQRQRMLEHEARLRHGPFERVDDEQRAVGHVEHALHLAAEVGMAGRVDDVDLHVLIGDGDVLGKDGDAALALLVVGVEHALFHLLVLAEHAGRVQQAVDHRGLAMVNVRDDGDVADVLLFHG